MTRRRIFFRCLAGMATTAMLLHASMSASGPAPAPSGVAPTLETAVKATYLYKLAPFVNWPASEASARPFNICVIGHDPFGAVLDRAIAGQAYGARPIQLMRLSLIDAQSPCEIAYIGGSSEQPVAAALKAVQTTPILTVTDESPTPGMVDFIVQNSRVRFRIDQAAAEATGLSISSKLLSLALSVSPAPRRGRP